MNTELKTAADEALTHTVEAASGAPCVVALVTDRKDELCEVVAGKPEQSKDQPMTLNAVMAILSTTKAITGTTLMQLGSASSISKPPSASH